MIRSGITTLYVDDMERAIEFYTKTLGLPLRRRSGDKWAEVVAGADLVIGLHPIEPGQSSEGGSRKGSSSIKIGLHVDHPLDEVVELLRARGVELEGPVDEDESPVRLAFFADPDGHPLYLFEYAETAARA